MQFCEPSAVTKITCPIQKEVVCWLVTTKVTAHFSILSNREVDSVTPRLGFRKNAKSMISKQSPSGAPSAHHGFA